MLKIFSYSVLDPNLIIDISTLEPVVVDDGGNIEKNRKLFINSVLSENKLDQKDVLSIRANNDKSNYKMLIDPKNIQKLDVNIVGTDEHLVKLSSNSFELGGKKYFNGSTDKNRNVIIAVDTKFDGKTMEEAKIQISGTQDFISGFIPPKFHNVWGKEVIEVEVNSVEVNSKKRIYIDVQTLEPIKMKTHNGEKILDVSGYENILGLEVLRVTVAKGRTGYSCRYLNPNTMEPLRIKSQVGENLRTNKYGYTGTPFDINKIRRGGTIITGFKEPPHFRSLDPKWHIAVTVDGENYITVQKDDLVY